MPSMRICLLFPLFLLCLATITRAQSKTTRSLQDRYEGSFSLFFYNNTLRMINQAEDKEFDEIIRDIEKMKLLIVRKKAPGFDFGRIVQDYKAEAFEEVLTSRHKGKNFDIYVKEKDGKTKAMLVLVNDEDNLFVLDIVGRIAPDKVSRLYAVMDESSDIGARIERFINNDKEKEADGEEDKPGQDD